LKRRQGMNARDSRVPTWVFLHQCNSQWSWVLLWVHHHHSGLSLKAPVFEFVSRFDKGDTIKEHEACNPTIVALAIWVYLKMRCPFWYKSTLKSRVFFLTKGHLILRHTNFIRRFVLSYIDISWWFPFCPIVGGVRRELSVPVWLLSHVRWPAPLWTGTEGLHNYNLIAIIKMWISW
jgi:hypothetical protein